MKNVFKSKKKLKGKILALQKILPGTEKSGFKNVWEYDGRILYRDNNDGQKIKIYYQ